MNYAEQQRQLNRALLELSKQRRQRLRLRRELEEALKRQHWSNTAAGELAEIHIDLHFPVVNP